MPAGETGKYLVVFIFLGKYDVTQLILSESLLSRWLAAAGPSSQKQQQFVMAVFQSALFLALFISTTSAACHRNREMWDPEDNCKSTNCFAICDPRTCVDRGVEECCDNTGQCSVGGCCGDRWGHYISIRVALGTS